MATSNLKQRLTLFFPRGGLRKPFFRKLLRNEQMKKGTAPWKCLWKDVESTIHTGRKVSPPTACTLTSNPSLPSHTLNHPSPYPGFQDADQSDYSSQSTAENTSSGCCACSSSAASAKRRGLKHTANLANSFCMQGDVPCFCTCDWDCRSKPSSQSFSIVPSIGQAVVLNDSAVGSGAEYTNICTSNCVANKASYATC